MRMSQKKPQERGDDKILLILQQLRIQSTRIFTVKN
jgi:hypothetical protein